ncbi:MAG: VanZ family protein [Lachnospiraceae bacterium]|nr:VanZ family protein [Lachnospiraceae bacterium]
MKLKKIYTAAAVLLLIALYIAIFCFSGEDGESSSALSRRVTDALLNFYHRITAGEGEYGPAVFVYGDVSLEGIVRKAAHFMEYLCMGFLSYSLVAVWHGTGVKGCLLVLGQIFLSAGLDEFHQYFIPGRCASFRDVLIDLAGGSVGILLILAVVRVRAVVLAKL